MDRLSAMVSELLELTNLERASRGERLSSGQLIRSAADQAAASMPPSSGISISRKMMSNPLQ